MIRGKRGTYWDITGGMRTCQESRVCHDRQQGFLPLLFEGWVGCAYAGVFARILGESVGRAFQTRSTLVAVNRLAHIVMHFFFFSEVESMGFDESEYKVTEISLNAFR